MTSNISLYNIQDWCWIVQDTNSTTKVYHTGNDNAFINNNSATALAWLNVATNNTIQQQITNIVDNGSTTIRVTIVNTGQFATGQVFNINGVQGTTEANGNWVITVVDGTHVDLQSSTFTNTYISDGVFQGGTIVSDYAGLLGTIDSGCVGTYRPSLLSLAISADYTMTNPPAQWNNIFMTATGKKVFLPAFNTTKGVPLGSPIFIWNNASSSGTFDVYAQDQATFLSVVYPNEILMLILTDRSTANGSFIGNAIAWQVPFAVGIGGTGQSSTAGIQASINLGRIVFASTGVNFNSANTDTAITVSLPIGYTRYRLNGVIINGASHDISTATFGLFSATGGGGSALIAGGTAITVTATADNTNNNMQVTAPTNPNTESWNFGTLYFRVGTAEGVAATASVVVDITPLP